MGKKVKVLLVEDDNTVREMISQFLKRWGYHVHEAPTGTEAVKRLNEKNYDIVVTDLKLPGVDGLEILRKIQGDIPKTLGILITGFGTIQNAIEAMRLGAFDYMLKPLDMDQFKTVIERALDFQKNHDPGRHADRLPKNVIEYKNIIGRSNAMQRIFELIENVSDSDSTVLIYGESGTGKELIARAIHHQSPRNHKLFVPINCAAIPSDLLESELFGYERGAFTGAHRTKIGRFEYANEGTLLLDEIGEMSPHLQVKLLRVLQERTYERLGSVKPMEMDVRIIAATHQNIEEAVGEGRFREDLYYRLNVIPIQVPPLRERKEDIPLLIQHFMEKFNREQNRTIKGLTDRAKERLMIYPWPGNVRELENLIERMVVLKRSGVIDEEDLPKKLYESQVNELLGRFVLPEEGIDFSTAVQQFERELILQALKRSKGVKKEAAKLLSLKRTTLIQKMKRKSIEQQKKIENPDRSTESTI